LDAIINGASAYTTAQRTYVVTRGQGITCPGGIAGDLVALRIVADAPPKLSVAWCALQGGKGSPIVTTTDGKSDAIVWGIGAEGTQHLMGFDGDTGRVVFAGGGAAEAMSNVRRYSTAIAAKGRLFIAGDDAVYAFTTR
jgi:hypothetical protein